MSRSHARPTELPSRRTEPRSVQCVATYCVSVLRSLEILQIRRRLVLFHGHDEAVAAAEIDLLADGDVGLPLDAIILVPPDLGLALEGLQHRPRSRQRIVDRGHLVAQDARLALVDVDP